MNTNYNLPPKDVAAPNEADELHHSADKLLDEAESMIWALLDDSIEEKDLDRLETLIAEDDAIRNRYVQCVQLHVDLMEHFRAEKQASAAGDNPNSVVNQLIAEHLPNLTTLPHVRD